MKTIENSVRLIGNLGSDPEIKTLESGVKVSQMSIATKDMYKNKKGEKVDDTQWHRVVAFGKLADVTENYFKKGKKVAIEGKLVHRNFEDKLGNPRTMSEILATSILMLGTKVEA